MSYGFGMFFKQVNSKADAMEFGIKVTENILDNALERIQNAKYYIPSHVNFCEEENQEADKQWLYSCFTNCFVYWPEYKLLGMMETRIPGSTMKMFDSCIHFQNSTDQDYDYKEWDGISYFEEIRESVLSMTQEEILKVICSRWGYDENDEEEIQNLKKDIEKKDEYNRKSALYSIIFDKLDLETWMEDDKNSDSFIRFNLCAINGGNTYFNLCNLLRFVKKEVKKEME